MRPKKVILCVDDDEQALSVLKFLLVTHGYRVLEATRGEQAIALFKENHVDLVLADHLMPEMDGNELIRQLKAIARYVPMILLGDLKQFSGQPHAADALLAKGAIPAQEMLQRVKIMVARKRGPRKGAARAMALVMA